MLLQFAIVLISLRVGTVHIVAMNQEILREEFRRQVSAVIWNTTANVSRLHQLQCRIEGTALRDEISEKTNTTLELIAESNREHESTAEELKECIRKDLDAGLRKVNEGVETTVTQAVDRAVNTAVETAVQTTVAQAVDRAVTTAVDRAVTTAVDRAVTTAVDRAVTTAVDRAVTTAVDRAVTTAVDRAVTTAVDRAVTTAVDRAVNTAVGTAVNTEVAQAVDRAVNTAIDPIEQLLRSLQNDVTLLRLLQLGHISAIPASSCSEILAAVPSSPTGYYLLRAGDGSSIRVYCDMTQTCGGITGGWMQVANIDMTDSSHTCPQGLRTLTTPLRMCGRSITSPGCSSAIFNSHGIPYTHVCGEIIGYQDKTPNAFRPYYLNQSLTIDDTYIDGVSLTHGSKPRKHIWSFVAAIDEIQTDYHGYKCPCIDRQSIPIPPWVGNDYFCDSGAKESWQSIFYPDDPLWDGEGCGPTSTCCSFNNPPWFSKQLPSPTTDDIEMRLCVDQLSSNEGMPVEKVELYVQ